MPAARIMSWTVSVGGVQKQIVQLPGWSEHPTHGAFYCAISCAFKCNYIQQQEAQNPHSI